MAVAVLPRFYVLLLNYKLGKVLKQAAFDSKCDIYHLKYLS